MMDTNMDYDFNDLELTNALDADSNKDTLQWLQSTYLMDSGIHSSGRSEFGSKSQTMHSLVDDMDADILVPNFSNGSEIRGIAPSQCSISTSVLSEMINENRQLTPLQPRNNNNTELNKNHTAKSEFLNYETAMNDYSVYAPGDQMGLEPSNVVSGLISLLSDEDEVVVSQAMTTVLESALREDSRPAIMNSLELVSTISRVMTSGHDRETTKTAANTLHNLSHHQEGRLSICKSGSVAALVKLLQEDCVLSYAITTIHNLLLHVESAKIQIRAADGIRIMVMLLRKDNEKFLTVVTDCLQLLTYGHQESKEMMLKCNGPAELIRIIQTYQYEKLLWTTTRVLKVLSVCNVNKQVIIACGGMQALNNLLHYSTNGIKSSRLLQCVLWTIRNLSDAATKIEGLNDLLESLVHLLRTSDDHMNTTCTVGILSNLTCYNQMNKQVVCQVGGIETLLRTIHNAGRREDVTEPAVCALRHLTSKFSESAAAHQVIMRNDGVQVVMDLFHNSSSWPLIRAIVGLLRNLSQNSTNFELLRTQGVVSRLSQLLVHVYQRVHERKSYLGSECVMEGGIKMEDLIELIVATLLPLAQDRENRQAMMDQQIQQLLTELIFSGSNANTQRLATDLLHELK